MNSSSQSQSREKLEDLDLRLGPSFRLKGRGMGYIRGPPEFIIIDDDDDEEEQAFAPATSRETRRLFPCPSSSVSSIPEEDLDLRLGVGASNGSSGNTNGGDTCLKKGHEASRSRFTQEFTEVKLRCAICMDTMKEETSTLCGHIFCKPCIMNSILAQKRCPTCRKELSLSSIHRIFLPGATS